MSVAALSNLVMSDLISSFPKGWKYKAMASKSTIKQTLERNKMCIRHYINKWSTYIVATCGVFNEKKSYEAFVTSYIVSSMLLNDRRVWLMIVWCILLGLLVVSKVTLLAFPSPAKILMYSGFGKCWVTQIGINWFFFHKIFTYDARKFF